MSVLPIDDFVSQSIHPEHGPPVFFSDDVHGDQMLYADGSRVSLTDPNEPPIQPADEDERQRLRLRWWTRQGDLCLVGLRDINATLAEIKAGRGPLIYNPVELRQQRQQYIDQHRACMRAIAEIEGGEEPFMVDPQMEVIAMGYGFGE